MVLTNSDIQKEMQKLMLKILGLENLLTERLDSIQKEVQDIKRLQEKLLEFETKLGLVQQKEDCLFDYSGTDCSRGQK